MTRLERVKDSVSPVILCATYFSLLLLLSLTVWTSFWEIGEWSLGVAIAFATLKSSLVILFFMELVIGDALTRLFLFAGLGMWVIAVILMFSDYLTR